MPMISGTHYCAKCGFKMFWEYHLPDPMNNINAFTYTKGSHSVKLLNSIKPNSLELRINCTKCNHADVFTYKNEIKT